MDTLRPRDGHERARVVPVHASRAARDAPRRVRPHREHVARRSRCTATPGQTVYAASKTALVGADEVARARGRREGHHRERGVPGLVDTEMTSPPGRQGRARYYVDQTPLGRTAHARGGRRRRAVPDVGRGVLRERRRDPGRRRPHGVVAAASAVYAPEDSSAGSRRGGSGWTVRRSRQGQEGARGAAGGRRGAGRPRRPVRRGPERGLARPRGGGARARGGVEHRDPRGGDGVREDGGQAVDLVASKLGVS